MHIHRQNPYIDQVLAQVKSTLSLKKKYATKILNERRSLKYDPTLGEYFHFTWDEFFFNIPSEIIISMDGFVPDIPCMFHSHDFFEIVYVYSGHCHTLVQNHPQELNAGDICLYDLRAIHKMEFQNPEDIIFNITVQKDLFRRILLELLAESDVLSSFFINSLYNREKTDTCILLKVSEEYSCELLAQRLVELYYQNPPMAQHAMKSQLILLLLENARKNKDEHIQNSRGTLGSLSIADVIVYLNNHYHDISLEETAQHFGYSTRSITRFLLKNTGHSFREVLQDVRFSHARSMLQKTHLSIDEIAYMTGYRNRSSFESAFKKYCHITPSSYRRQFSST